MPKNYKKLILVFFVFIIILSVMQFTVPNIIGFDGYLHIKAADIIKQRGFIEEFPWAKHTILSDNYADIQLLFRVLLIPFTFFGLEFGAKMAAILFGAVCFTVFYWFLTENKIKYAFFWAMLYLFTAESLMYRFMLPRQMPLVIALLILTIYFMQKKKYLFLAITSFAYILIHSSFVFQLSVVFLFVILNFIFSKKFDYKIILYSLMGAAAALVINPYFPDNIFMLYTQIFKVNLIANLYNQEWRAWPFFEFIKNNILALMYITAGCFILIKNKKITRNNLFYLVLALFFLVFTIKSRRMQEFLIPFSIIILAFLINDYYERIKNIKILKNYKILALFFLMILVIFNFVSLRKDIMNNSFVDNYGGCAGWMGENIEEGSLVFVNAYAFPYLFFKNSELIYTHGADLTYSYLYNKEEFERYMGILRGTLKSEEDFIVKDYKADYVFAGKIEQDVKLFEYIIKNKKNYKAEYEDEWCAVLKVQK